MNNLSIKYCCAFLLVVTNGLLATEPTGKQHLVVFLVRHADKADSSEDAPLSSDGTKRSAELSRVLADSKLQHVHSTDFVRTRATANAVAARHGLKVKVYDRRNILPFVKSMREVGGRHLVVGHSSSLAETIRSLGGGPIDRIDVAAEYDRLYVVTVDSSGTANTVLLRYGVPFKRRSKN